MTCNHNISKDRYVESCPACFGEWHAKEFMLERRVKELEAALDKIIDINSNDDWGEAIQVAKKALESRK